MAVKKQSYIDNGIAALVSMKSGLEGRNNTVDALYELLAFRVSMKSGLEGRNK